MLKGIAHLLLLTLRIDQERRALARMWRRNNKHRVAKPSMTISRKPSQGVNLTYKAKATNATTTTLALQNLAEDPPV